MLSPGLLVYCLLFGGIYLVVVSIIIELIERAMKLHHGLPPELIESAGWTWWGINLVMEILFYVAIPTLAYAFFYFMLPLSGPRAGMAAALYAFTIGAAPVLMGLSVRIRLPMPFMLFLLLSYLVKVSGSLIIISYLYSL
jgi:hypothetical protein